MQEMRWLDSEHVYKGSLNGAIELANQLFWALSVAENSSYWLVYSGEALIFKTDSKASLDAFLYGLGLAYGSLPEEVLERLVRDLKGLVE
jgi:hypothetical protein